MACEVDEFRRTFRANSVSFQGAVVGADCLVDKHDNAYTCCQVIALDGDECGRGSRVSRSYKEGSLLLESSMPNLKRGDRLIIIGLLPAGYPTGAALTP